MQKTTLTQLQKSLQERILILDGAMGTMIQKYKLTEADFRGERFKESAVDLRGNNDLLTLTQPLLISAILMYMVHVKITKAQWQAWHFT